MALQKDGVILVAQGARKFVKDMRAATKAYQKFINAQAKGARKIVKDMGAATKAYQKFINVQAKSKGAGQARGGQAAPRTPDTNVIRASHAGIAGMVRALGDLTEEGDNVLGRTPKINNAIKDLGKGFALGAAQGLGLNSVLALLTGGIGGLGVAAGQAAVGGLKSLFGGLKNLTSGISDLLKKSVMISGRVNELGLVTQLVGQRAGYTSEEIDGFVKGVKEVGISTDVAQGLIAGMARSQLDLTKATELASVAADAAIYAEGGADTTETLARLQRGIQTYQTEVIRTAGIQVNIQKAFKDTAKALDIDADAMTETQKQAAVLNAVLKEGEAIAGSYELAMTSPSKALRSLLRLFKEIMISVGAPFQDAFGSVVFAIKRVTEAFMAAVQEGGALYPILIQMGAVAAIVADGFAAVADHVVSWVNAWNFAGEGAASMVSQMGDDMAEFTGLADEAAGGFAEKFTTLASDAFDWGADIIIQLSQGIIDATSTALDFAIQQVGNMLTFWMAPGSPPRIAPKLRDWGVGYMSELLGGMTDADFGVLESIQGPLQSILGDTDFAKASKKITEALEGGDRGGVLDVLGRADKDFGPQLVSLAEKEFGLADAVEAVTKAEEDLLAAQERSLAVRGKVSAATDEYNELLREGASQAVLDAQLTRINAAEKERLAAIAAEKAAEKGIENKEAAVEKAGEQLDLQKQLLDQLFMYNDALTEEEKRENALAGGGAKGGAGLLEVKKPLGAVGKLDIGGAIGAAVDRAKSAIKEKFRELFVEIKSVWNTGLIELSTKWNEFKEDVGIAWDTLKEKFPFLQDVETWIVDLPGKIGTLITNGWDLLMGALGAVWSFLDVYILPIFKDLAEIVLLAVEGKVLDLIDVWAGEGGLLEGWEALKKFWDEDLGPILKELLPGAIQILKDTWLKPLITGFDSLKASLVLAHLWLNKIIDLLKSGNAKKAQKTWRFWKGESPSPMAVGFSTAASAMERMATVSIPKVNQAMSFRGAGAGGATYRPAGSTTNQSNNFNFNTTNNTGMDQAMFESAVLRVVHRAVAEAA